MINENNASSFVRYFEKRLLNLDSSVGAKFRVDYDKHTNSRLTSVKARHLAELLDNAFRDIERIEMLEQWAAVHVSPDARKRFLTAERQKKAKAKNFEIVMLEATGVTRSHVKERAREAVPELTGIRQPDILELLVSLGLERLEESKKAPGHDASCEIKLEVLLNRKSATEED